MFILHGQHLHNKYLPWLFMGASSYYLMCRIPLSTPFWSTTNVSSRRLSFSSIDNPMFKMWWLLLSMVGLELCEANEIVNCLIVSHQSCPYLCWSPWSWVKKLLFIYILKSLIFPLYCSNKDDILMPDYTINCLFIIRL